MHEERGWVGLPKFSQDLYRDTYFFKGENYDAWLARITIPYVKDTATLNRIQRYIKNYWFQPSTPISSGVGLPISCYVSHVSDTRESIFDSYLEGMWLGAEGGGRGVNWSDVRGSGASIGGAKGKSSGVIPFLGPSDRLTYSITQAGVRRSTEAAYLRIDHPDIKDFINIRLETGDKNRRMPNLHHGIVIPDSFMLAVKNLEPWDLICPKTKQVVDTIDAYDLWMDILEIRKTEAGEPYLLFIDTVNQESPIEYRLTGRSVTASNICSEIVTYTDPDTTTICCLGSLNLEYYDEWKHELQQVVSDCTDYLDGVLDVFLEKTKNRTGFERARKAVIEERNIGLGTMGWHSYLQSRMIPFESPMAKGVNLEIFKSIRKASDNHQYEICVTNPSIRCELSKQVGTNRRNLHTLATAPTLSISTLANLCSSGIEPWIANSFTKKVPTGSYVIKNKFLDKLLHYKADKFLFDSDSKAKFITQQWKQVDRDSGSARNLECLTEYEKDVFKTAFEIDQRSLINQAGDRAPYICQAQSLNIFVPAEISYEELHVIHYMIWESKIKSAYYLRSEPEASAEAGSRDRKPITLEDDTCVACT